MTFFTPQGIGDSLWALTKVWDVAVTNRRSDRIDIVLSSSGKDQIQSRAVPFLERFPFINSVSLVNLPCVNDTSKMLTPEGYWDYMPDGPFHDAYALMPNAALERGIRLEDWLPQYRVDWNVMQQFRSTPEEEQTALNLEKALGRYVVLYLGPLVGNTHDGHNRGGVWRPCDWVNVGDQLREIGYQIVVVGAEYDRAYWATMVAPQLRSSRFPKWHDFIGRWHIGQTVATIRRASLVVSYQSGIGILSHYLGIPTVMWWRAKGDSTSPNAYISFEEGMKDCWTNPAYQDRYLGLIYGRSGPEDVVKFSSKFLC